MKKKIDKNEEQVKVFFDTIEQYVTLIRTSLPPKLDGKGKEILEKQSKNILDAIAFMRLAFADLIFDKEASRRERIYLQKFIDDGGDTGYPPQPNFGD